MNMLKFNEFLNESKSDFQVYHRQYSTAIDEIEKYANSMGYELDQEEYGNAYVDAFFKNLNWDVISNNFEKLKN